MFLILASIFFICFSCITGDVFVDMLVFNIVFILINILQLIRLFSIYIKVPLDPLEEKVFENYFKEYLPRTKFKELIRKADLRYFGDGSQICNFGNSFTSLFYVGLIHNGYEVKLYREDIEFYNLEEDSWIGTVEFVKYVKSKGEQEKDEKRKQSLNPSKKKKQVRSSSSLSNVKWGIGAKVKRLDEPSLIKQKSVEREELYELYPEPCYIYIFNIKDLEVIFEDGEYGTLFRNSIYSIWLHYTSKAVVKLDNQLHIRRSMTNLASRRSMEEFPCLESETRALYKTK
jgi:hypothetical protein